MPNYYHGLRESRCLSIHGENSPGACSKSPNAIHRQDVARDSSVYQFWDDHDELLEQAWVEWNQSAKNDLPKLDASLLNPKLVEAVERTWAEPSVENEKAVKDLWKEVAPGVFSVPFFEMERISKVRQWMDASAKAGIPTRPPYGIVLNKNGVMMDPRSVGYLAAPDFQSFYKMIVETYVRPMSRMLYPNDIIDVTDDDESFAFSIQYQGTTGGDKSIRHHTDASTVTFNINVDSEKSWTGSSLIFFTENNGNHQVEWEPGHAIIHLGKSMHAALPIESGTRSNWVLWTMGSSSTNRRGYGAADHFLSGSGDDDTSAKSSRPSVEQRWTKSAAETTTKRDYANRWSPF